MTSNPSDGLGEPHLNPIIPDQPAATDQGTISGSTILSEIFNTEISNTDEIADPQTLFEINTLEDYKRQVEISNYKQNVEERKKYAEFIFSFTCTWCIAVVFILLWTGLGKLKLSDLVLTTLLGSTTLNVFGFFYLVTQYLFNKEKST